MLWLSGSADDVVFDVGRAAIAELRDALTYYTRPLTGAYYFVPSTDALRACSGDPV